MKATEEVKYVSSEGCPERQTGGLRPGSPAEPQLPHLRACVLSHFSRARLHVTLWTVAHPGSSGRGILRARALERVAMPSSKGSSRPRDRTCVSCNSRTAGRFFITEPPGKPPTYLCGVIWRSDSTLRKFTQANPLRPTFHFSHCWGKRVHVSWGQVWGKVAFLTSWSCWHQLPPGPRLTCHLHVGPL